MADISGPCLTEREGTHNSKHNTHARFVEQRIETHVEHVPVIVPEPFFNGCKRIIQRIAEDEMKNSANCIERRQSVRGKKSSDTSHCVISGYVSASAKQRHGSPGGKSRIDRPRRAGSAAKTSTCRHQQSCKPPQPGCRTDKDGRSTCRSTSRKICSKRSRRSTDKNLSSRSAKDLALGDNTVFTSLFGTFGDCK